MARNHGRVFASMWADEDFLSLSPDAKYVYNFLLAQGDLGHSGIIVARIEPWARKLGFSADHADRALSELHTRHYILFDRSEMFVLVRSLIRRDGIYKQPNVFKSAAEHIRSIDSKSIRRALISELQRIEDGEMSAESRKVRSDLVAWLIEDTSKGSAKGSGNPSGTPAGTPPEGFRLSEMPEPASSDLETDETAGDKGSGNPSGKGLSRARTRAQTPTPTPGKPLAPSLRSGAAAPPTEPGAGGSTPVRGKITEGSVVEIEPETENQRINRLAKIYYDNVSMGNFPAIMGVVKKAVRSRAGWDDDIISSALMNLAREGRPLTVTSLRIQIEGMPPSNMGIAGSGGNMATGTQRAAQAFEAGRRLQELSEAGQLPNFFGRKEIL
jgi:hypothetical protein